MIFLPFFWFHPRMTSVFRCFLRFAYERNAVFSVFRSSLTSETLFLAISAFRSRATNDFLHFWLSKGWEMQPVAFFDFPNVGKTVFRCFLIFPSLGKSFFAVFQFSQCWDGRFLPFFVLSKFGKADFRCFSVFLSLEL